MNRNIEGAEIFMANRKEEAFGTDPYPRGGRPVKNKKLRRLLAVVGTALGIAAFLVGAICLKVSKERAYYADPENYVRAAGRIEAFGESEAQKDWLGLGIRESPPGSGYLEYRIDGPSFALVKQRGLIENLYEGAYVEYTVAPAIFGDDYSPPIVAIAVDGTEYLSFEEGYENLRLWLLDWKHVFVYEGK